MRKSQLIEVPAGFRDSEQPALRPGEVVDSRFTVGAFVARGDTGVVFEARDMLLDKQVALKLAWRDGNAPRLLPEARQCSAVLGNAAVAILAFGHYQGIEYVAAERLGGERLFEHLGRGPISDASVLDIWRAIVEGMAICHACGMAVGDVSSHTVQLTHTKSGAHRAIFGRFSLTQVPALGPHGRLFAPEVIRGVATADDPLAAEAIDLYGLGAVAIELASGKPLFYDPEIDQVLRGHVERAPIGLGELRPDLPAEAGDLVDWLLAKDPDARPPSVAEVLRELDVILERAEAQKPTLRILVADGNSARARWLASLGRRSHARATVSTAADGAEASRKLVTEGFDLLLVDAALGGAMNALELAMYARSQEAAKACAITVLGSATAADQAVLEHVGATTCAWAPSAIAQVIRAAADERDRAERPRRPRRRSGVQG